MSQRRFQSLWTPLFWVAVILVPWTIVVLAGSVGFNPLKLPYFDFQQAASFGESFGFPVALFAAIAAIFTFMTLETTREENKRLHEYQARRDKADERNETEQTFFRLLDLRLAIIRDIQIDDKQNAEKYEGTDALHEMYEYLQRRLSDGESREEAYATAFETHRNDLGHYLRFTYHIVKFVVDRADNDATRYEYIRILRAQLSNSELCIIALNCVYGEGRSVFKGLVERFALLHNIHDADRQALRLDDHFQKGAFEHPTAVKA